MLVAVSGFVFSVACLGEGLCRRGELAVAGGFRSDVLLWWGWPVAGGCAVLRSKLLRSASFVRSDFFGGGGSGGTLFS